MDYLQEGIGLRGYGQRDPLVEYQREGYDLFVQMMDAIKEESVGFLFNLDVQVEAENAAAAAAAPPSVFTGEVGQLGAMQEMPAELLGGGASDSAAGEAGDSAVLATERGENRTIEPVGVAAHAPHLPTAFEEHEQIDPADRLAPQHVSPDVDGEPAGVAPVAPAPAAAPPAVAAQPAAAPAAPPLLPAFGGPTQRPQGLTYSAPSVDGEAGVVRTTEPAVPAAGNGAGGGASNGAKPAGQQQRSGGPNRNASRKKNKRRR
jgi:preprotein translocase subunit SecA